MAARYRFRLEPVLRVRKRKEDLLKEDLARLKRLCDDEKEALRMLLLNREHSEGDMAGSALAGAGPDGGLDLEEVLRYDAYISRISNHIEREVNVIIDLEGKVHGKTQEVIEASREKKIVEKLKAKRLDAYVKESFRVEQNELDEVGSLQFARRRRT